MAAPYIYVIGNCVPYDIKTLREDATGAQMKMQADACAHQRAKSRKATLCSQRVAKRLFVLTYYLNVPASEAGGCKSDSAAETIRAMKREIYRPVSLPFTRNQHR